MIDEIAAGLVDDAPSIPAVVVDGAAAAGKKRRKRKKKKKTKKKTTTKESAAGASGDGGDASGERGPNMIVLGVPRSGTSVVTSTIIAMGASWLGKTGVMLERPDGATTNPRGFFERHDAFKLNWRFLHKQGIRGPTYFDGPKGDLKPKLIEKMKGEAADIVADMNAGCVGVQPWVFKLMRYELAHSLWSDLEDIRKCIIIVPMRDPVEVKASTWSYWQSLEFWARDTEKILERAARFGHRVVLVSHKALMSSPDVETRRLHSILAAAGVRGLTLPAASVVDASLYRKREEVDPSVALAGNGAVLRLWLATHKLYTSQSASLRPIEPDALNAVLTEVAMEGLAALQIGAASPTPPSPPVSAEVAARFAKWGDEKRAAWKAADATLRAKCATLGDLEDWIAKQTAKALRKRG